MLTSRNEAETFTARIPLDLIIEIFSRLPVKSIARFRCLSKIFASTLRNQDFTKSFFTISSSRPKLLFTCKKDGETFFFSSPLPQTPSPIAVTIHMSYSATKMGSPVRGLVCGLRKTTVNVPLICNPSTGQSLSLPSVPKEGRYVDWVINYLGYDPIDNQFKVLCIWCLPLYLGRPDPVCHQVLTLRTGKKPLWRMIRCDIRHDLPYKMSIHDMCINGVLYYLAMVYDGSHSYGIVCFDVRSEKFSDIKQPDQFNEWDFGEKLGSTLVNYKGKLAVLHPYFVDGLVRTGITGIQLWVLEDAGKHEWSRFIYILPPPLKNVIEETELQFVLDQF